MEPTVPDIPEGEQEPFWYQVEELVLLFTNTFKTAMAALRKDGKTGPMWVGLALELAERAVFLLVHWVTHRGTRADLGVMLGLSGKDINDLFAKLHIEAGDRISWNARN